MTTDAEPRIARAPGAEAIGRLRGLGDHAAALANALGLPISSSPAEIMDEIARLTPTFSGVSYGSSSVSDGRGPATTRPRKARAMARAYLPARQGPVLRDRIRTDTGVHEQPPAAAADHRPRADPVHNVDPTTWRGATATSSSSIRRTRRAAIMTGDRVGVIGHTGATAGCAPGSPRVYNPEWSLRRSISESGANVLTALALGHELRGIQAHRRAGHQGRTDVRPGSGAASGCWNPAMAGA